MTAAAAAAGSLLGAAASIATTWITQRTQTIRENNVWKLRERETLYGEFITEASRLAVDALAHSLERPDNLVALYGILGRIRLISGEKVLDKAEDCCRRIVDLYATANELQRCQTIFSQETQQALRIAIDWHRQWWKL